MSDGDPELEEGWIAHALAQEHPGLRLRSVVVDGVDVKARSSNGLRRRLRLLSSRLGGPEAVLLRGRPVPQAYRVFFREIGLDPDTTRTPVEQAALTRLVRGGYASGRRLEDALLLGLVETHVPMWALDDELLDGPLGIREAVHGESLGTGEPADELPGGRLVVADARCAVGVLFGPVAPSHVPAKGVHRVRVFALQVAGVPELHVEEALWLCAEALVTG